MNRIKFDLKDTRRVLIPKSETITDTVESQEQQIKPKDGQDKLHKSAQ